jgi:Asp-tRNA(Asn)/Glu-tRNA(Gln) amidotransferase A subunit family amidase
MIEDIALGCEILIGHDERDPDTRPRAHIPFREIVAEGPPLPPLVAFIKTPLWERTDEDTREAFAELIDALDDRVVEVDLPDIALDALELHRTIMEAEMAAALVNEYDLGRERLSESLRAQLERGRAISAFDYQAALARIPLLSEGFTELFDRCDAILTPAVAGTAPKGLASTGDPSFCTLWTLCGMPALAMPLLQGANGLPLGVQLVGQRHHDARLLRTARWLADQISGGEPQD